MEPSICEEDTRDRHDEADEANMASIKGTKLSKYIAAEKLNVDLDHTDAAAIDKLADKLDDLSVFLFPAVPNPMKRLFQPLQVHVPSLVPSHAMPPL